jgi:pimeloyl-ACP methyl ester carboxylesterase
MIASVPITRVSHNFSWIERPKGNRRADQIARLSPRSRMMPMLVLTGEKASGEFLIQQGRLVADKVEGAVIKGSGHWLMEEAPGQVLPERAAFINR